MKLHRFPELPDTDAAALRHVLEQLERSQWMTQEQLVQQQSVQLRQLVGCLLSRSPFYRKRLKDAGITRAQDASPETWRNIAELSRVHLQSLVNSIKLAKPPVGHRNLGMAMTSGSTGTPVRVATTDSTRLLWNAFSMREHLWQQRDFSLRLAAIRHFGDSIDARYPHGKALPDWGPPANLLHRTGPGMALDIHTDPSSQLDWLQRVEPHYLITFPSNAAALTDLAQKQQIDLPGLRELRLVSEPVDAALRESIRSVWGIPVSDFYSAQETGALAIQCPEHDHYHVQSENVLLEVVDATGAPCRPGDMGRVLVTTLHNFAMPLVRYDIGDYAEVGEPCPCGRGLPVLTRIFGRVRNLLTLPDGTRHWPNLAATFYREVAPVIQHQLVQTGLEKIEARLVVERALSADEEAALKSMIAERLGYPFDIEFSYPARIERGRSGKFEEFLSLIES